MTYTKEDEARTIQAQEVLDQFYSMPNRQSKMMVTAMNIYNTIKNANNGESIVVAFYGKVVKLKVEVLEQK